MVLAFGTVVPTHRGGVSRQREARRARQRLYPVSCLYTAYAVAVLILALRTRHRTTVLLFFAAGALAWTALEYFVHRHILHGRFPDGEGLVAHLLHRYFDHLHLEHHKRPWDGNHVNGTTRDTLPFILLLAPVSFLAPLQTLPVFVAGVMQTYIIEEWIHHSVHFCLFRNRYFRYIKRHHLYHHSPRGTDVAYGLTSGLWDVIWRTRIPASARRLLHAPRRMEMKGVQGSRVPPSTPSASLGA